MSFNDFRAGARVPRVAMNESSPELQFCLNVLQGNWDDVTRAARTIDANGVQGIGVVDSPALERDVYLAAAACALSTERTKIFTAVTNPVSRHPCVAASALLQVEELAPGRVICGIATGDSAMWGVGLRPAKVETLREYVLAIKALLRGDEATWKGKRFHGHWRRWSQFELPVYVACSGPKAIRMRAQVADGLILSNGFASEDLDWAHTHIREACQEVGKDPGELDLWYFTEITFGKNTEASAERSLGWLAHWFNLGGTKGKLVPEKYKPLLAELNADNEDLSTTYDVEDRGAILVRRAKRLGLYDWLMSHSARLWGTPVEVRARCEELRAMGVSKLMLNPDGMDLDNAGVAEHLGRVLG